MRGARLLLAAWALAALPAAALATPPAVHAVLLQEEARLAKAQQFYLVLDLGAGALDLRLAGVTLRRFPVREARLGQPRLRGGGRPAWPALSFTLESEIEEPDRPVIRPPAAGEESATLVDNAGASGSAGAAAPAGAAAKPLSLAESLTAFRERTFAGIPPVYRLHFTPGLDLVIRGEPLATDWQSRLRRLRYQIDEGWDGFTHWLTGQPVATRVLLFLSPDDAKRLYLTLDPAIRLLVVAADPAPR